MAVKIARRALMVISCISLLIAIAAYYTKTITPPIASKNTESTVEQQLLKQARAIAVKIRANRKFGSGITIRKTNNIYTIVTNRHVVDRGQEYYIQTSDDRIYLATLVTVSSQDDLAILEFTSDRFYPVANINLAPLRLQEFLFAAGFPFNSDRLQITPGKLFIKTNKPLKQGYQLGYSNSVYKGMSGGAIFNSLGEVVGINGRSANPIIADYQYQDLSYPSERLREKMAQLSWGIPINKAMKLISD